MTNIAIPGFYVICGLAAYAALNNFALALDRLRASVRIPFAIMCLMAAIFAYWQAQVLQAADIQELVRALKWGFVAMTLLFMALPWFIAAYTGRRATVIETAFSVLFAVILPVGLLRPYGMQYDSISATRHEQLPWGEWVTVAVGTNGLAFYFMALSVLVLLGYALYSLVRAYRAREDRAVLVMAVAFGVFLLFAIEGILIRGGVIHNFVHLGACGFLAIMAVMSVILAVEDLRRLRSSEMRFRSIVEQSPIGISFSRNGLIVDANRALLNIFGYADISEFAGTSLLDRTAPESRDAVADRVRKRTAGMPTDTTYEQLALRKDGTKFPMSVTAGRVELDEGLLTVAFHADITDRRRSEENEKRLRRTLTLLSRCNAMIARATEEQQVADGICRLAVDVGGYLMAWVGVPQADGTVIPVAQSGYEDGYLESIRVTWREGEPEGQGPIGIAVRTGKTYMAQDILNDPKMAIWHEPARRRGYRASVALPMLVDGQVVGVLIVYSVVPNAFEEEEVGLLETLVRDLTSGISTLRVRKEKDAALHELKRESEKNFALLRSASDGIHILDANGTIIEVSSAFCEMLGYRREEVIGVNISDWRRTPFEFEPQGISVRDRLSSNVHSTYETRYRTRDGRVIDVEVRSFPLTLDGRMVLFNSWRDVTESKAAYLALQESEQKLRGLYELSPVGIALREFGGNYVDFNEAYRKITGYEVVELIGMDNWMLTPPEWAEAESLQIESLESKGRYGPFEKEYIRKDGARVPVRLSGVMVTGQDGRRYVWSIVEDISEGRRIQDEIQARAAQLRSLLANHEATLEAERKHIAREVHDELGQTLTSLGFEISALRLGMAEDDIELAKIINTMSSLTSHAIHVTRNVAENLRPAAMNMGIAPAIEWLCNRFTAHSGTMYTLSKSGEFDDMEQPQVDVLFRIAQESLTNVLRHAHAGNVAISLSRQDDIIELSVSDDGAGFETGNSRWPRSFGLLGMRERAAMMGGSVDIRSAPGQGTTVTARMPYKISEGRR